MLYRIVKIKTSSCIYYRVDRERKFLCFRWWYTGQYGSMGERIEDTFPTLKAAEEFILDEKHGRERITVKVI